MAAPVEERTLRHVIVGEVVLGHSRVQAFLHVTEIFVCDGFPIVLQMAGDKELPSVLSGNEVHARGV